MNTRTEDDMELTEPTNYTFKRGFISYLGIHFAAMILYSLFSLGQLGRAFNGEMVPIILIFGVLVQWIYVVPMVLYLFFYSLITKRGWFALLGVVVGALLVLTATWLLFGSYEILK